MPNTLTGLFQTIVLPATEEIQQHLQFRKTMLDSIYIQRQPQPGSVGQTINVNIPTVNEGDVIDIGNGPIQITDTDHATVPLTVNANESVAFMIRDFDAVRTPVELRQLYMAPKMEALGRKINRRVCNLVTTGNFNAYTAVTGGADVFSRANIATGWGNLVGAGVPMTGPQDVKFVTSHTPYANMIGDTTQNWISENIVGLSAAEMAQQTARLMPAYGAAIDYDQQFPVPSAGVFAGLLFHRAAIAMVPVTPPSQQSDVVEETFLRPFSADGEGGPQVRVQLWYDPDNQGYKIHMHAIFALSIVRANYGSFFQTT